MTVGVVASCSPAEWGLPRDRLCCARTGAPHRGNPSPPPHTQGLQGRVEYWKAQCGESRMLRLGGGSAPFHDRRCCPKGPCLNCGERIERPALRSGTSWGGKPADNGPDLRASPGEKGLILCPMLTREICV